MTPKTTVKIILLLLLLTACAPEEPEATQVPIARATNTAVPTTTPPVTPLPTSAARPDTPTPMPTETAVPTPNSPTPIPTATANPNLSQITVDADGEFNNIIMSSQGQLSFINDNILFIETSPGSKTFQELGRYALTAAWSPDGSQLAYRLADNADMFNNPDTIFEQRLLTVSDGHDITFSQTISGYPDPPYFVTQLYWTPDGTKLLFQSTLDERHEEEKNRQNDYLLSVVDLEANTFTDIQFIYSLEQPVWLTNERYILRNHCGSPCATFSAYDYTGREIWNLEGTTGGFVAFAPQGDFMINIGRYNLDNATPESPQNRLAFVDEINLTTGEVKIIWQITGQGYDYFTPFLFPTISADGQFITFNYGSSYPFAGPDGNLYIIDRLGNEYRLFSNAVAQDWRPNGGLAFIEILETGENRLVYDPLDADFETVFTTPPGVEILGGFLTPASTGKWSPDGRYFPFATWNPETEIGQLYLWQPEHGSPTLVLTTDPGHSAANFLWTPDAGSLYFTTGEGYANNDTLWRFDVE